MLKAKASMAPAMRLAKMRGRVMRRAVVKGDAPRLAAASSRVTEVCWRPAKAARTREGRRRIAEANTKNRVGLGLTAKKDLQEVESFTQGWGAKLEPNAKEAKAKTKPGTARGSKARVSRSHRRRRVERTMT